VSGTRTLHRVAIEADLVGTATFNDATGTKVLLPAGYKAGSHELNVLFSGKLEVVTSAADRLELVCE
jgi:hypothetical protein